MIKLLITAAVVMAIISITQITVRAQSHESKMRVLNTITSVPIQHGFSMVAARIYLGKDTEAAYRQLDTLLSRSYGDMFWMYGCAGLYYATGDRLRPEYKARIRWCWKHCTPYRGDTENHFLMYYGSLFLMAQAWPDLPDTDWFMGKSSKEIYDESKEYLDHWIDETVRNGQEEWDSPRYGYYYITPLVLLAEYTQDKRMKHRFEMMLEYELASYAADYLNGSYCGAHSRVSDECAIDPHAAEIETYGNYFFGESGGPARLDTLAAKCPDIAFAAMTSFECPKIIRDIANDRNKSYEQFSLKCGRQMLRYLDQWSSTDSSYDSEYHAPVYKYDYMTKDYCLGSMQGGIVQPIQQQSWSLVFNSDKHHNIITGLNPFVSATELGMFFPEYPSFQLERISETKASYTSENKWEGGSPYEHIYQDENVLVALYDISDSVEFPEYDLFIGDSLTLRGDDSKQPGWLSADLGDSILIWIYMMSPFEKIIDAKGIRLRSRTAHGGYIVWCEPPESFTIDAEDSVRISGSQMEAKMKEEGWAQIFNLKRSRNDSIFHSPFLESKKGSGILTMCCKGETRVLDFNQ